MNSSANVPATHKVRKGIAAVIINAVLLIFSLSCIFPIVWMMYSSLKEKRVFNADIMGLPKDPTLINYIKILSNKDYHLGQSMLNSVRTTVYHVPDGYADPYPFSAGSYLCSIPEMRNQQQMVHFASSICILWSPYRYFPGRGLCEIHSGITGRGCGN